MQNNFFEEGVVLRELQKMEENIQEEMSKENVSDDKITKMRFEQLMKGMLMTQDPNYIF